MSNELKSFKKFIEENEWVLNLNDPFSYWFGWYLNRFMRNLFRRCKLK